MKINQRSYQDNAMNSEEKNKWELLQLPNNPKAPKKTMPDLKLDEADTKTNAKNNAKTLQTF